MPPTDKQIDLSIIVVAYSVKELMDECLTAVKNSTDSLAKEIIYVDNGSTDGSVEMVKAKFPEVIVIESPLNLGFIRANNLAYTKASGKYILMLNSDAFVGKETLQKTCDFMEQHADCGVLGVRLLGRDGKLQPSARYEVTPWRIFLAKMGWINNNFSFLKGIDNMQQNHNRMIECDWVPGCYLLTRKKIIDEMGFFLRQDFFMYYDDADICLRIKRKGWKVIFYPEDIVHIGGGNAEKMDKITEKGRQIAKLNLESGYIYFRQNYNLLYVLLDFFLIIPFAFFQILKKIFLFKKNIDIRETFKSIVSATSILIKTGFGKKPIH
jgi:N-acetylglucosaminyl-diphospho-decaprenol L-rhamnosyltransferase